MSITRNALRQAAKSVAQDSGPATNATGVQLLLSDPGDYDRAIDQALGQFASDRPNRRVKDYTVTATGFRFPLHGASSILPTDPAAPSLPTVALAAAGAGNVDNGSHQWAVTGVYAYGETELSQPSAALTVVDKSTNGKVTVTISDPADVASLTGYNVYRTAVGGTVWKKVGFVVRTPTTTTYQDNTADVSLGVEAPQASLAQQPDAWIEGASSVASVWWPYTATNQGDTPMDGNSWRTVLDPGPVEVLEFVSDRASSGDVIRLEFLKPHVVDDDDPARSTIRRGDINAIVTLTAVMILTMAANKAVQNTGNTGLPNDVVDRRTQSDQFRSRAKELLTFYGTLVGKPTDKSDVKPQSGFLDLDMEPLSRFGGMGGFFFHPSRGR